MAYSIVVKHAPCLLTLKKKERIQAFETKCLRKLLGISYSEHKTNDCVRSKINFLVGPQEPLQATVKGWKLAWFGHVTRHDRLSKTILQGTLEAGRRRDRQRKCWMGNIKASTLMPELIKRTSNGISVESSVMSARRSDRSGD